jgi:hypothetical protein
MSDIFTLENIEDFSEKLNIDDLYEKKKQHDLGKLTLFNKILNRIHVRIKTTSKQNINEQFCWFLVPEIIIGVPKYDNASCIAYLLDKLKKNGFNVKYIHPNTLLISWNHWVPSYVRSEIKNKTGIIINEYGEQIEESNTNKSEYSHEDTNYQMFNIKENTISQKQPLQNKNYTPIKSYKPSGKLVYNDDLLNHSEYKIK